MKILIACEYSGIVRDAFIAKGHDAISCDILPTESPGKHYQGDVFDILGDGWDMMVAFPPCTHLANSGAAWFEKKRNDGRQREAIDFFLNLAKAPINKIAIENPIGIMGNFFKKPTQIIQPYYFGDGYKKSACLWLKNLPCLFHNATPNLFNEPITHVKVTDGYFDWIDKNGKKKKQPRWYYDCAFLPHKDGQRSKARSKTFPGIAQAMAEQWG